MVRYAARRILVLIPVLLGLSLVVFTITRLLPGDPVRAAAGPNASEVEIQLVTKELGLDQPIIVQYFRYASGLVRGDWGVSIFTRRPVLDDILTYLPATLEVVIAAMLLAVGIGIPAGLISAIYADLWPDYLSRILSISAISLPRFFLGLLLQLAFASWLGLLPLSGRFPLIDQPPPSVTGFLTVDAVIAGDFLALRTALLHLALPATATCLSPLATITRMMRASTIEVLQQDYILSERALGLSPKLIAFKYVLKNAMSATLTVIGLYFGWLLGGTVLVETVFDWPGIGLYATNAILTQDFMPIMGVTLMIGVLFLSANLIVDLLYGAFNPKVRFE